MNERDSWTVDVMEKYGGSFVQALARAARCADPINLRKIKLAWANLWSEYEMMGRGMQDPNWKRKYNGNF